VNCETLGLVILLVVVVVGTPGVQKIWQLNCCSESARKEAIT